MKNKSIGRLILYYDIEEKDAAELVSQACEKSTHLLQEKWGLYTPKDCRVYIMTSWTRFIFQSAPWTWKVPLALTVPLWANRFKKTWSIAGGWELSYGQRRVVGIKPARLIQLADRSIGTRIFIKENNLNEKVQHITCHELTHAFTSHLKLPIWLKEGLAMVMVDQFFGRQTVKAETLDLLRRPSAKPSLDKKVRIEDEDALVYLYVSGYWRTLYLQETQPELLTELLCKRYQPNELEIKIAAAYGINHDELWEKFDEALTAYFNQAGVRA